MYDDDLMNFLNSLNSTTTTTTEPETNQETAQSQNYNPQTDYNTSNNLQDYVNDDYSVTPNYTEQKTYDSNLNSNNFVDTNERVSFQSMEVPMIEKEDAPVNLIKRRQKIRFEPRMKIVASVFSVIVACLLFISIFNFVQANRIESTFGDKQAQINELRLSINQAQSTYSLISEDGYVVSWAEDNNFVEATDENTITVKIGERYTESVAQELPSNWFNDVCDFVSRLFA